MSVGTVTRNGEMPLIQSSHLPEAYAYDHPGPYFSSEGLWRPAYPHNVAYAIANAVRVHTPMKVISRDGLFDIQKKEKISRKF